MTIEGSVVLLVSPCLYRNKEFMQILRSVFNFPEIEQSSNRYSRTCINRPLQRRSPAENIGNLVPRRVGLRYRFLVGGRTKLGMAADILSLNIGVSATGARISRR